MCKSEIYNKDPALLAPLGLFLNQYFNTFFPEDWLLLIAMVIYTFVQPTSVQITIFLYFIDAESPLYSAAPSLLFWHCRLRHCIVFYFIMHTLCILVVISFWYTFCVPTNRKPSFFVIEILSKLID